MYSDASRAFPNPGALGSGDLGGYVPVAERPGSPTGRLGGDRRQSPGSPRRVSEDRRLSGSQVGIDDQHVSARIRIATHPGHYMNHEASHLVDARSVEYWASLPGHVRDQVFTFELDQETPRGNVLSRVEWKDRGDVMGVARLSLEAQVGDGWQKLSTWDAAKTPDWQTHTLGMSMRSQQWRLTFVCNHSDDNHLVVQAVRFVVRLPPTSPAHNVMHSQRLTQQLWGDGLFTDVEVICGERRFSAHRAVLAAASPVLAAMLRSEMKEGQAREIVIEDAEELAVFHTLEYIYTGTVGEGAGCGMVRLGHKYDIPGLIEYAAPVALGNLTPDNVVREVRTLRMHADDKQLAPVFEALQNKIRDNPMLFHALMMGI